MKVGNLSILHLIAQLHKAIQKVRNLHQAVLGLVYPEDHGTQPTSSVQYYQTGQETANINPPVIYSTQLVTVTHPSQTLQNNSHFVAAQGPRMQHTPPAEYRDAAHPGNRTLQRKAVPYSTLETERKMYQKAINDKDKTITSLRQDFATLQKNNTNLVKEMSVLSQKKSISLESE